VADQFLTVQDTTSIRFRGRIYYIGYDLDNALDIVCPQSIMTIGLAFLQLYPQYQSFFAVHQNTQNLHFHMILNNIPVFGTTPLSARIVSDSNFEYLADIILERVFRLRSINRLAGLSPYSIARNALLEYYRQIVSSEQHLL